MATITIQEHPDLLTIVIVFTVPPEQQDAHIEYLQKVAADQTKIDGFISCAIFKSEDGVRVTEYVQWRSREHFEAMRANLSASAHTPNPAVQADAHLYEIVSVISA
jgi:heme-degrading monooxygenase HmoA